MCIFYIIITCPTNQFLLGNTSERKFSLDVLSVTAPPNKVLIWSPIFLFLLILCFSFEKVLMVHYQAVFQTQS